MKRACQQWAKLPPEAVFICVYWAEAQIARQKELWTHNEDSAGFLEFIFRCPHQNVNIWHPVRTLEIFNLGAD